MKPPAVRTAAAAVALLAAILPCRPAPARAAADPYQQVSLALGQQLVAFFPPAEGLVVSAVGDEVFVDLAEKDLLRPGMELQVYRPGDDIVHPVTKQVLGTYERTLGWLHVVEVREKYSRASLDGEVSALAAGDRVRVSARRLKALLRFTGRAPGIEESALAQALIGRGDQSGRFMMVDEPAWEQTLAALGPAADAALADPATLRLLGERTGAELLFLVATEPGPPAAVGLSVRSLRTGAALAQFREPWPATAPGPVAPPREASVPAAPAPPEAGVAGGPAAAAAEAAPPAEAGTYAVRELSHAVSCFAAGDVLGERRVEVVLSDGSALALYRWEEAGLAWKWEEKGRPGRRVLALDAADLDGDGRAEVVVSSVANGRVRSSLRVWRNGALEELGALDGVYLRAVAREGRGAVLLGQRAGVSEVLTGRVEEYRLAPGGFERVGGTALPARVGIFGLGFAGDAVLSLSRDGYLSVLGAAGSTLWRSPRPYGGYRSPATARELFGPLPPAEEAFEEESRAFQRRVVAERTPGGARVAVPRNFGDAGLVLSRHRELGHAEVVVLEGALEALEETARSRSFDGYVSDIASADVDGDGRLEILFAVNRSGGFLKGERGKLAAWRLRAPEK